MKLGMVGLPNVGKSTLFNALTNANANAANYPFCTIEPNEGTVLVPDNRIDVLSKMYSSKSVVYATLDFVDIAGLVKGASKGEGLGNKFLADIREVDAIIHVVRCFEDSNIVHVDGSINAKRDIETINLELIFSDLEILSRRIDRSKKMVKGNKNLQSEIDFMERLKLHLEEGKAARSYPYTDSEREIIRETPLLSAKPVVYAANLSEKDFVEGVDNNLQYMEICKIAKEEHSEVLPICAELEAEIVDMDADEKAEFLNELKLTESGLNRVIEKSYALLGLMSFLTTGTPETRAWTIKVGTKAPQAAGKIHTDFERGFIRAEVVSFNDLMECKTMANAKAKGLVRLEGKEYVMQDGDIVEFMFNV